MSTRDLDVLNAIGTLLAAASVAGGRIYQARGDRIASDSQLPAIDLWLDDGRHDDIGRPTITHETLVQIDVIAVESGSSSCLQIAEPVRAAVHAAVMADRTLGGKVASIKPERTTRLYDDTGGSRVRIECFYAVRYHTRADSLTS